MAATVTESAPKWIEHAVSEFIRELPPFRYDPVSEDHGFSNWVRQCTLRELWRPNVGWRKLMQTCRDSNQVRGFSAVARTRTDIIMHVVNSVYRQAEDEHRRHTAPTRKPEDPALVRQVRDIISKNRVHEQKSITLSKLLDFAFMLTAYVECLLDEPDNAESLRQSRLVKVEADLKFFEGLETKVESLTSYTCFMENEMTKRKWLPWYEEVPSISNSVVVQAREAAMSFCTGIPFPRMDNSGVAGLVQSSSVHPSGMDHWLLMLLDSKYLHKWEEFTVVYTRLSNSVAGKEEPLLEELSRRVVAIALEPLMEQTDKSENSRSLLAEIIPEILNRQSIRSPGMLTFRMLLELHIYLSVFRAHLIELFYLQEHPDITKIHMAVVLFGQLVDRIAEIRYMLRPEQNMVLMQWSMASIEKHQPSPNVENPNDHECLQYKKGAIGAVLGRVFIKFTIHWEPFNFGMHSQPTYDPLVYASVIAEWDPLLAAKIIDVAIQITIELRRQYERGNGHGVSLYMYRRIVVCDAAKNRTNGDSKAAGAILAKLHPVWDVVDEDKKCGNITLQGLDFMRSAVERGNFEAATFYGLLISSPGWAAVRKSLGLEQSIDSGIRLILQALENGDFSSSIDLANIITSVQSARPGRPYSKALVNEILTTMREAAPYSPMVSLHLGYVFSVGGCGVQADTTLAMQCYEKVLAFPDVTAATRAHAINNLAILITISQKSAIPNDSRAPEYLVMASVAGNLKSKTNLAAMYCYGVSGINQNLTAAEQVYRDYFSSTKGKKPVCLMQKSDDPMMVHISQVLVDPSHQETFLKTIGSGRAPLLPQNYGKVLFNETLPVSRVL